jgi:hypothetical protein
MSILKRFSAAVSHAMLPLLILPGLLHAEEGEQRWYQVELILFSQNNPNYLDSEMWPLDYTLPNLEGVTELVNTGKTPAPGQLPEPFSLVSSENLQLTETAKRINKAEDVELLLHLGWLQPGLPEDKAMAVHLYEGMLGKPVGNVIRNRPESVENTLEQAETLPRIDGTVRLILSRYHHLESDLVWREPLAQNLFGFIENENTLFPQESMAMAEQLQEPVTESVAGRTGEMEIEPTVEQDNLNYQIFRQQQSRRMRSNEVHYIDHPLFGIIALVTRHELPKADEPEGVPAEGEVKAVTP